MMKDIERLTVKLASLDMETVQALYDKRRTVESERQKGAERYLIGQGYERVEVATDDLLTPDGREIVRAAGESWALRPDIHAQRLAEAMERAKQRDGAAKQAAQQTSLPAQSTCTALIDGQLCGGTLVRAAVCPRCALGKSGVAATLTCDVCGHVTAIMRGDS